MCNINNILRNTVAFDSLEKVHIFVLAACFMLLLRQLCNG